MEWEWEPKGTGTEEGYPLYSSPRRLQANSRSGRELETPCIDLGVKELSLGRLRLRRL